MPVRSRKNGSRNGHFEAVNRRDVPSDRKGKHHEIVGQIMQDLVGLAARSALKIPLVRLGDTKIEHIRAALSRAAAKAGMTVASRVDETYLYVWNSGR